MRLLAKNGGIGRYTLPPCTTKRKTTINLKTKKPQNSQKIKLYVSPTTKELKKKHSSRLVGGAEMGSQGGEEVWRGGGWRTRQGRLVVPHSHADKPGETSGEQDRPQNPGFQHKKRKPQNFWLCAHSGSTCTEIGMIQRRLVRPLCKDDTQIHEAVHIFRTHGQNQKGIGSRVGSGDGWGRGEWRWGGNGDNCT